MKILFIFLIFLGGCSTKVLSPKENLKDKITLSPEIQIGCLTGECPYTKYEEPKILFVKEKTPNKQRIQRLLPLIEQGYCPVAKILYDFEEPVGRYNPMTGANYYPYKRGRLTPEEIKELAKDVGSELVVGASYEMPKGMRWVYKVRNYQGQIRVSYEWGSYGSERATRYEMFFLNKKSDIKVSTNCDLFEY
tara:strand:+ start:1920 stop:2495 length:576 start_codon:yes stop_codon:yes gene_type:complete